LETVLAHQPADLLMIDDDALVPQLGADAAIAVSRKRSAAPTLREVMVIG
jgi:hypothetical protein